MARARTLLAERTDVIVETSQLSSLRGAVAMVDGGFDPLHAGHVSYFREARARGLPLLCNVRDDRYLSSAKGRGSLLPETQRAELLDALEMISYVHICRTSTREVLELLAPAAYVKGADWRGRLPREELDVCASLGIEIVYLDTVTGSSTDIARGFLERMTVALASEDAADRSASFADGGSDPVPGLPVSVVAGEPGRARSAPSAASLPPYRFIVSSHLNRYLSGVAKFNHILAGRLGASCVGVHAAASIRRGPVLVSVKLSDCAEDLREAVEASCDLLLDRRISYDLFFHSFDALPVEHRLLRGCRNAFAGNAELTRRMRAIGESAETLWCPALLDGHRPLSDHRLTVFSFGMSHKIRLEYYRRFRQLLDAAGLDYELLVSTAFHEKASFGDMDLIERSFRRVFGDRVHLMGFLSDESIDYFLRQSDLFCAFFPGGVRANNTTAFAAMETGTPLLTNLDTLSPRWMRHGVNVLDIHDLRPADLVASDLVALAGRGREDVAANASWNLLASRLGSTGMPAAAQEAAPSPALQGDGTARPQPLAIASRSSVP